MHRDEGNSRERNLLNKEVSGEGFGELGVIYRGFYFGCSIEEQKTKEKTKRKKRN